MADEGYSPADEKVLALTFSMTALIRALSRSGHLEMDELFRDLAGARGRLEELGEDGAAAYLGSFAESLQRI